MGDGCQLLPAMAPVCPLIWRDGLRQVSPWDMSLICPHLAVVPGLVVIAALGSRAMASVAHEVRLVAVAWLALRRTQPSERSEILHELGGATHQGKRAKTAR